MIKHSPQEAYGKLKTYFKFLIVREPLDRLLSAYRNKFENKQNTYFHEKFGKLIVKRFRKNASNSSGNDVTFAEFVEYILSPKTKKPLNEHWRPIHELCSPCQIKFDMIGKFETLQHDSNYILKVKSAV